MLTIRLLITIDSALTGSQYTIRKGRRPYLYQELSSIRKIHLFLVCKCLETTAETVMFSLLKIYGFKVTAEYFCSKKP